jgi:hypothetical protein
MCLLKTFVVLLQDIPVINLSRNKTPHRVLKEVLEPLLNQLCFMLLSEKFGAVEGGQ